MKLALLCVFIFAHELMAQPCRLEVRPVDPQGVLIETGSFLIETKGTERPTNKLVEVPCGRISMAVWSSGFKTSHILLITTPGDNYISVGLNIGNISGAPGASHLAVVVRNINTFATCDRIRIIPIYQPEFTLESPLSHQGRASVNIQKPGVFLFALTGPDGICGTCLKKLDSSDSEIVMDIEPIGR